MELRVSPVHIKALIVGVVCFFATFALALFYGIVNDPTHIEMDIKLAFCGVIILAVILLVDMKITARKIFFKVEMTDEGISERLIRTTQQIKWSEVEHIYIVGQPYVNSQWLCLSKEELTKKDFLRVLSSRKSIVFPLTAESQKYVTERSDVKIISNVSGF